MTAKVTTLRRFAGANPGGDPAPIRRLVLRLRDYAVQSGFVPRAIQHSRARGSTSCYLHFDDARGRRWIMRCASHRSPRQTGHEKPHIELVSFDGLSGSEQGKWLIDQIAADKVTWFDPAPTVRNLRPGYTRKGNRRPSCR